MRGKLQNKHTYACAYKRLPFFQFDSTQQQTRLNN